MQKIFLLISILCLFVGQIDSAQGQGKYASNIASDDNITVAASKDSGTVDKKADTSAVELSPVAVPVALHAGHAHRTYVHYAALQPSLLGFSANFISGNLNHEVTEFIKSYYHQNLSNLPAIQLRAEPYFPLIEKVFAKFGIPKELKYLAVVESGMNTHARSNAGAVGAWQFMASTARLLGLRVNAHHDDRKNLYKSTVAAAKYLDKLYNSLDNWLLVIAAYNCGPGGVLNAIQESGSSDFWKLKKYLPRESQKHVMKFLATAYIMNRFAEFFGVNKQDLNFQIANNKDDSHINKSNLAYLQISGKYSLAVIAKYTAMDLADLHELNPGFEKALLSSNQAFTLRLPAAKMILFKTNKNKILNESINLLMENNRLVTASAHTDFPQINKLPERE